MKKRIQAVCAAAVLSLSLCSCVKDSSPPPVSGHSGGPPSEPSQSPAPAETDGIDKGEISLEEKTLYDANGLTVRQESKAVVLENGSMTVRYYINSGFYELLRKGTDQPALTYISAEFTPDGGSLIRSCDLERDITFMSVREISDEFGTGILAEAVSAGGGYTVTQGFYLYSGRDYILLDAAVTAEGGVSTNYIAPVAAEKDDTKTRAVLQTEGNDPRFLFVPYDNDAFVRYSSIPASVATESYEVTSVFDNNTRAGFVTGSVTHDLWKTGIRAAQNIMDSKTTSFKVFGGITSKQTRDTKPHNSVSGDSVRSPKIYFGFHGDYRDGLEEYGRANALAAPPLPWDKGIPMGWNSWSAVADKITFDIYTQSSDFLRGYLQNESFAGDDGLVYINFDSFWTNLSEEQLIEAARHVRDNGQIPGIYFTPFAFWGSADNTRFVDGTNRQYRWNEILLKDENGVPIPSVDGAQAIDVTHPGARMYIENQLRLFKEWGYQYIKLDFMTHGALEGKHYDSSVMTGVQAYNYGMQIINDYYREELDRQEMFLSLSIAPVFPAQYAHSRRISCDVFGTIDNAEYMLNSLTYGWWLNDTVYKFNDPDHIVVYNSYNHLDAILYNEGLTRYISSVIAGTMLIDSDDFRIETARERAKEILTNAEVNALAREHVSFRPVEGNTRDAACDTFVRHDAAKNVSYLAVFNFSSADRKDMEVSAERIGLDPSKTYVLYDMVEKTSFEAAGLFGIDLEPAEPKLYRITAKG